MNDKLILDTLSALEAIGYESGLRGADYCKDYLMELFEQNQNR